MEPNLVFEAKISDKSIGMLKASGSSVSVGREPIPGGLQLNSSSVSRRHGMFQFLYGRWLYSDCGSTNGSWINEVPLDSNLWYLLKLGDLLRVADCNLRFKKALTGTVQELQEPTVILLKDSGEQQQWSLTDKQSMVFCSQGSEGFHISPENQPECLFSLEKQGGQIGYCPLQNVFCEHELGLPENLVFDKDTVIATEGFSLVCLVPGSMLSIDNDNELPEVESNDTVDPTLTIALETLDLTATQTIGQNLFGKVDRKNSSTSQKLRTRRNSFGLKLDENLASGFWNSLESKLGISIAIMLLILIAMVVVAWLFKAL